MSSSAGFPLALFFKIDFGAVGGGTEADSAVASEPGCMDSGATGGSEGRKYINRVS